jgi:mRNA interferase RelE/StbE
VSTDIPTEASYEVVLSTGARRALAETLPSSAAFAAWEFISGPMVANPQIVGTPLREPFEGLWRARRGEYRVRYRIDEQHRRIVVVDIDHRYAHVSIRFIKLDVTST